MGDIPEVYNHCQPGAQVVYAHKCVFTSAYACVLVCTKVCSNLPGKLIWPKLSNPKILPTSFLMSDNLLLLVPCGFLLFG